MSVKVSSWVWHEARDKDGHEVAGNELVLMLALADVADDNGRCRFVDEESGLTYDTLAEKVRVSKRTVVRMVAALREAQLIDQVKGVKGRPNEFVVLVPWVARSGDNLAPNGDQAADDSVTTETDSVTTGAEFGDNSDSGTSLIRTRKGSVDSSHADGGDYSSDLRGLADRIAGMVRANGHPVGVVGSTWWQPLDRLVRLDGYTLEQIEIVARWATSDEFWAGNIRSTAKLRKQFSMLRHQRNTELGRKKPGVIEHGRAVDELLRERAAGPKAIAS